METPRRPIGTALLAFLLATAAAPPTLAGVSTIRTVDDLPPLAVAPGGTIDRSATVTLTDTIQPADGDEPAIRIVGNDLTVDFGGAQLRGAPESTPMDALVGVGVFIEGRNVTVRNLRIDGYRVGVLARGCDGLTLEGIAIERNFGQRLRSTPAAEQSGDWLWPHQNDDGQWRRNYGAAVCVESSSGVTLRRIHVRRSQNGIVLDRVNGSRIYDNDCSFLSGWGLAMWRSSGNVVSRNAFDFCVRGYSHGIYNRGQDSAGILLFEQCNRNRFVENSVTHGGDGVFGFAGREALGEAPPAGVDSEDDADHAWHRRRGCNENVFVHNDLSYAVAHGLELTFSFGNLIAENRFAGNAICGIWGGYSSDTVIAMNRFVGNGDRGYGLERGGVNIEHGVGNRIAHNRFERNRCGIHLWWDADESIMRAPWARANDTGSHSNVIAHNVFDQDTVAIHLRESGQTVIAENTKRNVDRELDADAKSLGAIERPGTIDLPLPAWAGVDAIGETNPVGARRDLRGRERIVMTEWGPYDWKRPLLHAVERRADGDRWRLLGEGTPELAQVFGRGPLRIQSDLPQREWRVVAERPGWVLPYRLLVRLEDGTRLEETGIIHPTLWSLTLFPWTIDPREDIDGWRNNASDGVQLYVTHLNLPFAMGGPADVRETLLAAARTAENTPLEADRIEELATALAALPRDRFGTIARTTLRFPPGRWRIRTLSDDGVRVVANGRTIIDNWTWHAPTTDTGELEFEERTEVELLVEHFEIDGYAVLELAIEQVSHLSAP